MTAVEDAYPTSQVFPDDNGMWFLARSSVIPAFSREATFLVAVPYQFTAPVKAWAFWTSGTDAKWIGPRHTNLGDGSVCAFSPADAVWHPGGDLRTLLDLYSVWALRHLHLEVFGRWPGKQYSILGGDPWLEAFYRIHECRDDEFCACGSESRRYSECCKPKDLLWNSPELAAYFERHNQHGLASRVPPVAVCDFMLGRSALPRLADVHPQADGH